MNSDDIRRCLVIRGELGKYPAVVKTIAELIIEVLSKTEQFRNMDKDAKAITVEAAVIFIVFLLEKFKKIKRI